MVGKVDITISDSVKHNGDVTGLVFYDNHLYSSGADGFVKIWTKDLELLKEFAAHELYIFTIGINSHGGLYTSSSDGTVKYFPNPIETNASEVIHHNEYDDIITIQCYDDGTVFMGDDKGVVSKLVDNQIQLQYNIVEEVKSLAVINNILYTVRDMDVVVTDLGGPTGRYMTKATIPGRAPMTLIGPVENGCRRYVAFTTRDGKGISLVNNDGSKFPVMWTKEVSVMPCCRY